MPEVTGHLSLDVQSAQTPGVCDALRRTAGHARRRSAGGDRAAAREYQEKTAPLSTYYGRRGCCARRRGRRARRSCSVGSSRRWREREPDVDIFSRAPTRSRSCAAANLVGVGGARRPSKRRCKPGASTWDLNEIAEQQAARSSAPRAAFLGYHGYPGGALHLGERSRRARDSAQGRGAQGGRHRRHRFRLLHRRFLRGFGAHRCRSARSRGETRSSWTRPASRSSWRSSSVCRETGCRTSAGRCSQHVEPPASRWCANFVGHGIGKKMHEDPPVPNYGSPGRGLRLKAGPGAGDRADGQRRPTGGRGARGRLDRGDQRSAACRRTSSTRWRSPTRVRCCRP